ncbi:hypothetical protein [Janthinobacterium lividum]|uniref:hypothetical protein n=1 Tax=Janthinobacterium lividum TaxID=29581 RepID=UPI0020936298|nr:hypothetical protein [Janthinobacterium lividum]
MSLPGSMARGTATASGVRSYQGAALAFGTTIAVTVLHTISARLSWLLKTPCTQPGISTA